MDAVSTMWRHYLVIVNTKHIWDISDAENAAVCNFSGIIHISVEILRRRKQYNIAKSDHHFVH